MPFHNMMIGRILTYQLKLHDEPGVLSGILKTFADVSANILTINQTIPSGGCALVTITAETSGIKETPDELLRQLTASAGVIKAEVLAG
jgi:chorismate mutase